MDNHLNVQTLFMANRPTLEIPCNKKKLVGTKSQFWSQNYPKSIDLNFKPQNPKRPPREASNGEAPPRTWQRDRVKPGTGPPQCKNGRHVSAVYLPIKSYKYYNLNRSPIVSVYSES